MAKSRESCTPFQRRGRRGRGAFSVVVELRNSLFCLLQHSTKEVSRNQQLAHGHYFFDLASLAPKKGDMLILVFITSSTGVRQEENRWVKRTCNNSVNNSVGHGGVALHLQDVSYAACAFSWIRQANELISRSVRDLQRQT